MQLTLIGLGLGTRETRTLEAQEALARADLFIGAQRLLDELSGTFQTPCVAALRAEDILRILKERGAARPCVLYSGDLGFHSGAKSLLPLLSAAGIASRQLSGISSPAYFASRLGESWQDWSLHSAHGQRCDAVAAVMAGRTAFFLTDGADGVAALCRQLCAAELAALRVTVGENLSYENERITKGRASDFANASLAPLSVLLVEAAPRPYPSGCAGIPDEDFIRGAVPMTKQEVRAAILAKLAPRAGEILWDIGAGTGSVSIELSRAAAGVQVWGVECEASAFALMQENRARFGAFNLEVRFGHAPEVLAALPAPDAVFIGGSKGELPAILAAVLAKNPAARICISALAIETLGLAVSSLSALGREVSVTQIAVSRTQAVGGLQLLRAQNPIFLIVGAVHV